MKTTKDLFKRIIEQEKAAFDFGFYWESVEQLLEQIKSECDEIQEATLKNDRAHLREEVGDLINATISLCIFLGLDPLETLSHNIEKFQLRYDTLVKIVKQEGLENLKNKPMDLLLAYWKKAKSVQGAKQS